MKKIIVFICIFFVIVLIFTGIKIVFTFCPDDYGDKYNQEWISEDKHITFVTNNKKGLMSADFNCYDGEYVIDNSVYKVRLNFEGHCDIVIYKGESLTTQSLAFGDYNYNMISQKLIIQVESVDFNNSIYCPGDLLVFSKK